MNSSGKDTEKRIDELGVTSHEQKYDTMIKIYFDATNTIRHYDGERTATHRLAVAVLGSMFAFSGSSLFDEHMLPILCALGALLSFLFLIISNKYGALIDREREKARATRDLLEASGDTTVSEIDEVKTERHAKNSMSKVRISSLWATMYVCFTVSFLAVFVFQVSV